MPGLKSDLRSNFDILGNEIEYRDHSETFTDLKTRAPEVDFSHFRTRKSEHIRIYYFGYFSKFRREKQS
jgi:hypothetical protein